MHNFYHTSLAAVFCLTALSACGTTNKKITTTKDATTVSYRVPASAARVEMRLLLTKCTSATTKSDLPKLEAVPTISITPMATVSPSENLHLTVSADALKSYFKNRDVTIALHETGSISTVNATVADRTPQIFGNILQLAATTIGAALNPNKRVNQTSCKNGVEVALKVADRLTQKIAKERAHIRANKAGEDLEKRMKRVDALAAELTRIQMDHLTITLRRTIAFEKGINAARIDFNENNFSSWLNSPNDTSTKLFSLVYCVNERGLASDRGCSASATEYEIELLDEVKRLGLAQKILENRAEKAKGNPDKHVLPRKILQTETKDVPVPASFITPESDLAPECPSDGCPRTLVFREPVPARMQVFPASDATGFKMRDPEVFADHPNNAKPTSYTDRTKGRRLALTNLLIGQWGDLSYFDMEVGFGGRKTLNLTLDAFGRKTTFGTSSQARGEGITSFLSSSATAVSGIVDNIEGRSAGEDQATIDALTRQQNLNRLEACRMVIENGGFTCPTPE